ncbi:MAG: (d)CMP kinase [Thermoguttaceae bacterium]|nr:(d)CMP kinase [Thermoguttaceae bacterium]
MSTNDTIVTIDGPAGAGKSTVARRLAQRLNWEYLDTGGMYRAAALLGLRNGVNWNIPAELTQVVRQHSIEGRDHRTFLDNEDVSEEIRTPQVTQFTRFSADNQDIRAIMVDLQRKSAQDRSLVTEGRDQGSVVFPNALCKFYLTASPEVRAQRRFAEEQRKSHPDSYEEVLRKINYRDEQDRTRPVGPLVEPADAIRIDSDGKSIDEVVSEMERHVRRRSQETLS